MGRCRAVIIAYGNALRRDDAAGLHVAAALVARAFAGVEVVQVQTLVPELAERLAAAELAIFLDAFVGERVEVASPVAGGDGAAPSMTHVTSPAALVELAAALYGNKARAFVVTVPAFDLDVGEGLSAATAACIDEAVAAVERLLNAGVGVR